MQSCLLYEFSPTGIYRTQTTRLTFPSVACQDLENQPEGNPIWVLPAGELSSHREHHRYVTKEREMSEEKSRYRNPGGSYII